LNYQYNQKIRNYCKGPNIMFRWIPIKWQITVLSFGIVLFSVLIGEIMFIGNLLRIYDNQLGQRLLVTARTVAQVPAIINQLTDPQSDYGINAIVERIRVINNVDYIVVMNMHRKILTDPLRETIGTVSKSQDEAQAFVEHTYLSKATGDLGIALRAFVPVMNKDNDTQVGVVLVGKVLPSLWAIILTNRTQILITFLLSSFVGVLGAFFVARHIKRQMLDMEPYEITKLLLERTATFYAMHEGVISIDTDDKIIIFNDKSSVILGMHGQDVIGARVDDIGMDERIVDILKSPQDVHNQELQVGTGTILYSRVSIRVQDSVVGAIMIFQDRTEVAKLAEELTGVRAFVDALRVQNHEFLNKLHTIGGLVQLDNKEKVLEYIWEVTEQKEELTRFLSSRIQDDEIAGLLLAKINRGRELGVDVMVDRDSRLARFPASLDQHDLVAVIGNLVENAFEALKDTPKKEVFIKFNQDDRSFSLLVEDNGSGMSERDQQSMFRKGYTTKSGVAHGYGMYLVKSIVDRGNGTIHVQSAVGKGTRFLITFPMRADEV
jgi:two-component system sensor histidine kinase DctS